MLLMLVRRLQMRSCQAFHDDLFESSQTLARFNNCSSLMRGVEIGNTGPIGDGPAIEG